MEGRWSGSLALFAQNRTTACRVHGGCPCVAASLWPVDARATRRLVEDVFRRHINERKAPAAALRDAQFGLCGPDWRWPAPTDDCIPDLFTWAGFACYGG